MPVTKLYKNKSFNLSHFNFSFGTLLANDLSKTDPQYDSNFKFTNNYPWFHH